MESKKHFLGVQAGRSLYIIYTYSERDTSRESKYKTDMLPPILPRLKDTVAPRRHSVRMLWL